MFRSRLALLIALSLIALVRSGVDIGAQQPQNLTNLDVIKMVQGGLGEAIVAQAIKKAPAATFDVSPEALITLKNAGATEPIILEMLSRQDARRPGPVVVSSAPVASAGPIPVLPRPPHVNYRQIQIGNFDVRDGVIIPDSYLDLLSTALVRQLTGTKKFSKVVGPKADAASDSDGPIANLTGVITEFQNGNRAVRYLVGFGAGKTKIVARVKLVDGATGALLLEDDVDGKVIMGPAGGESDGAATGLAKEVAKVVNRRLF